MTHAASNYRPRAAQRPFPPPGDTDADADPDGPADAGLSVLYRPVVVREPVTVANTAAWAHSIRRFAQFAVWTLPLYALVYGLVSFGWYRDLGGRVTGYAQRASTGWYGYTHLIGGPLSTWLGLVALIALTGLLVGVRCRRTAVAGLAFALAGTVILLPALGLAGFVQPALGRAFLRNNEPVDATVDVTVRGINNQVFGLPAALTVLAGSALLSLGWFLLGSAVYRSRILNRADGVLLMIAAPLVGVGGALAGPLRTAGALLVLAAGIGLAVTAARLVPVGGTAVHRARRNN